MFSLCFYSVLKEIKFGEPYLYKYQVEFLNFTSEQLAQEVYPFMPYANMIALMPLLLLTDLFLHKPIMLIEVLGQVGFHGTLVFGHTVLSQVFGKISYGVACASEMAFFSYIYARFEKEEYQKITSWTKAGTMVGRTSGYLIGQFLILTNFTTIRTIHIMAFVMPIIALLYCIVLPNITWRASFNRILSDKMEIFANRDLLNNFQMPLNYAQYMLFRLKEMRSDFCQIYRCCHIRKWSVWWALTTAMTWQVGMFAQTLWGEVQAKGGGDDSWNGFAEAGFTATASLTIMAVNACPIDWNRWGEMIFVLISVVQAMMLLVYAKSHTIWTLYLCYICYHTLYQMMFTITLWNIAKKMVCQSYGLVFGINSFLALFLQSILTRIVADKNGFGFSIRTQYFIYTIIHLVIASIFLASVLLTFITRYLVPMKSRMKIVPADGLYNKNIVVQG